MDSPAPVPLARFGAIDRRGEAFSTIFAWALRTILTSSLQNSHVDQITENVITGMFGSDANTQAIVGYNAIMTFAFFADKAGKELTGQKMLDALDKYERMKKQQSQEDKSKAGEPAKLDLAL